ncbi:MAG: nucleotidyltransferase domain-containing protein [Candidatus Berkelbacteria bacterium]|nr:nucleotidyltransferase domain-containing protein [Candidatus Berkelbacteria bacterium]
MTKQAAVQTATKYLRLVQKSGINLERAYLFGSQALGTAHTDSDIDLCVVSADFSDDRQSERVRLMNLRNDQTDMIEPHPISSDDFDDRLNFFANEIKRTGVLLPTHRNL